MPTYTTSGLRERVSGSDSRRGPSLRAKVLVALGVIVAIIALVTVWNGFNRAEPGFVSVVRDGGPFDDRGVRQILTPADGLSWTGVQSTFSDYPTSERYDNVQPGEFGKDPGANDSLATDFYRTRTKDGVDVGIQGQWKYVLNLDPKVLEKFDTDYGQRTYAVPGSEDRVKVSDGDQGMAVFIAGQVRPIQQEAMRQAIGDVSCSQLEASCALLASASQTPEQAAAAQAALVNAPSNGQTFQAVSDAIGKRFEERINSQLGGAYLIGTRFTLQGIALPPNVADAISKTQAAIGQTAQANADAARLTAEARGRAEAAAADAQANVNRQNGYNACSTCAELDRIAKTGEALKNLPPNITVYAPGGGQGLNLNLPTSGR